VARSRDGQFCSDLGNAARLQKLQPSKEAQMRMVVYLTTQPTGRRPGRNAVKSNHQPGSLCDGEETLNWQMERSVATRNAIARFRTMNTTVAITARMHREKRKPRSSATVSTSPARSTSNWCKDLCQLRLGLQLRGRRSGSKLVGWRCVSTVGLAHTSPRRSSQKPVVCCKV
jgi:hypothetical protein